MSILWQSTIAICAVLLSILPHQTATAQDYPTKPVRIISGFGPGSAGDVLTRLVVPKLSQSTGQQFIVEYKPGAGSNIAAEFVVRAPADGYTLFLGTSANTINATFRPICRSILPRISRPSLHWDRYPTFWSSIRPLA